MLNFFLNSGLETIWQFEMLLLYSITGLGYFYWIDRIRGDQDKAFEWVKSACEEHDSYLWYPKVDTFFKLLNLLTWSQIPDTFLC